MKPLGRNPLNVRVISGFFLALKYTPRDAPTTWPNTVAQAAPAMPISKTKMKIGSKMILVRAPAIWVTML